MTNRNMKNGIIVLVASTLIMGLLTPAPLVQAVGLPKKSGTDYAKDACKEWAKVSNNLPKTQAQFTSWIASASKAVKNATPKAASAAKRDASFNPFLSNFLFLQSELQYLNAYRQFSNAKQWDSSVMYLKSTCYKLLSN